MKTIALRFADRFSPPEGTIMAHQAMIDQYGFVWYGKLGTSVSPMILQEIIKTENARILLIHSGKTDRYWAYIDMAQKENPDEKYIPDYYRDRSFLFKTWFRVRKIETAHRDVLAHCIVLSSGNTLSYISKYSMSPYYIIEYSEK